VFSGKVEARGVRGGGEKKNVSAGFLRDLGTRKKKL